MHWPVVVESPSDAAQPAPYRIWAASAFDSNFGDDAHFVPRVVRGAASSERQSALDASAFSRSRRDSVWPRGKRLADSTPARAEQAFDGGQLPDFG
jgi:hypothetical protein